jgi:hypothetical protein
VGKLLPAALFSAWAVSCTRRDELANENLLGAVLKLSRVPLALLLGPGEGGRLDGWMHKVYCRLSCRRNLGYCDNACSSDAAGHGMWPVSLCSVVHPQRVWWRPISTCGACPPDHSASLNSTFHRVVLYVQLLKLYKVYGSGSARDVCSRVQLMDSDTGSVMV